MSFLGGVREQTLAIYRIVNNSVKDNADVHKTSGMASFTHEGELEMQTAMKTEVLFVGYT